MATYRRQNSIKLKDVVETTKDGKIPFKLPSEKFYVQVPAIATINPLELALQEQIRAQNNYRTYNQQRFAIDMGQTYSSNIRTRQQSYDNEYNYNNLVVVYWDLGNMLDAYQNGYRISFINHKTSYELYYLIEKYFDLIDQIRSQGQEDLYEFDPRLSLLDEFNRSIFTNNTSFIKNKRASIVKDARKNILQSLGVNINVNTTLTNMDGPKYTPIKNPEYEHNGETGMTPSDLRAKRRGRQAIVMNATPDKDGRSPFTPHFYDAPVVDFTKIAYSRRYSDPEERRIAKEHLDAKRQLEGQ